MATLQSQTVQEDFSAGANRDVAPHLISDDGVYDLIDFVLDDDGSAYRRGGTSSFSDAMPVRGTWLFDAVLNHGRRTIIASTSKTYVLDSDDVSLIEMEATGITYPRQTCVMGGLVFSGGGLITAGARSSTVHTASGVVTVTNGSRTVTRSSGSWSGQLVPGHLMQIGLGRVYEVASVETGSSLTLVDAYVESSGSGKTAVFKPVYRVSVGDPYRSDEFVAVCHNRLVFAQGRRIHFSVIGDPHSFQVNDWHELPTGAQIVGVAELNGLLLVFTTDGIWTVDGLAFNIVDANGNSQHTIKRLSTDIVLAGACGVAGFAQRLVVPAADGIWLLDGVSAPERISRGIERPYRAWLRWGARLGQAVVFRGHYLLPIVAPVGTVRDMLVCRLNRPVKSRWRGQSWPWSRFQGDGGMIPAFAVRHGDQELTPRLLGVQGQTAGSAVVECSEFFNPDSTVSLDANGNAPVPQMVTRDYESGSKTVNAVRSVGLRYELIGSGGAVKVEWSKGGPTYDVTGSASQFRKWGDPDGAWNDPAGVWGNGFGPLVPDTTVPGSEPVWVELPNPVAESDGLTRIKCRINKRTRYSRFRLTCSGSVTNFRLRSLEIFTRPSQAVRR